MDKLMNWYIKQSYIKKAKNYTLIFGIVLLAIASAMALTKIQTWDIAEKQTIQSIYQGNKEQVEENKKAAYKRWKIAGAGDNTVQTRENADR